MNKLIAAAVLLVSLNPLGWAGKTYNLETYSSSASIHIGYGNGSLRPGVGTDRVFESSGAAVIQSTSSTMAHRFFRLKNAAGTDIAYITQAGDLVIVDSVTANRFVGNLIGDVTGNASGTSSALAANGANCSAGQYARGVDAAGAAEDCTSSGIGDAVLLATQTWTGANLFTSSAVFSAKYSSVTFIPESTAISATTFGTCVATVTYTPQSSYVRAKYIGSTLLQPNSNAYATILINGALPSPWSGTTTPNTAMYVYSRASVGYSSAYFETIPLAVTPNVSTSFCLMLWADTGGGMTIASQARSAFEVFEGR